MMDLPELAMDHYRMRFPHWAEAFTDRVARDGHPVRHRVFLGGRGGGKSWTIAGQLLLRAREKSIRILCTREFQNSIRDSSKRLLEDTIDRMGFGLLGDGFFTVTEREIRGRNGSVILFVGLNGKDTAIKSFEGIDIVWVEEAASVHQSSIDALSRLGGNRGEPATINLYAGQQTFANAPRRIAKPVRHFLVRRDPGEGRVPH